MKIGIVTMNIYDEINKILPNAVFDTDSSGEIIVATGYTFDDNGNIVKVGA
jgi:hypothetical protein